MPVSMFKQRNHKEYKICLNCTISIETLINLFDIIASVDQFSLEKKKS